MRVSERVMGRIRQVEDKENSAWDRDDLRVAWLTVKFAAEGSPEPWRAAFLHYFDGRPEVMIPFWAAREKENRFKFGPTLAEQLTDPDFLATLPAPKPFYVKRQIELHFITEAREKYRAVMQGKKAA